MYCICFTPLVSQITRTTSCSRALSYYDTAQRSTLVSIRKENRRLWPAKTSMVDAAVCFTVTLLLFIAFEALTSLRTMPPRELCGTAICIAQSCWDSRLCEHYCTAAAHDTSGPTTAVFDVVAPLLYE
eukprot:4905-Heterococcus_DN1.PRE.3